MARAPCLPSCPPCPSTIRRWPPTSSSMAATASSLRSATPLLLCTRTCTHRHIIMHTPPHHPCLCSDRQTTQTNSCARLLFLSHGLVTATLMPTLSLSLSHTHTHTTHTRTRFFTHDSHSHFHLHSLIFLTSPGLSVYPLPLFLPTSCRDSGASGLAGALSGLFLRSSGQVGSSSLLGAHALRTFLLLLFFLFISSSQQLPHTPRHSCRAEDQGQARILCEPPKVCVRLHACGACMLVLLLPSECGAVAVTVAEHGAGDCCAMPCIASAHPLCPDLRSSSEH